MCIWYEWKSRIYSFFKKYEVHSHSNSCKKYKNEKWCCHFGKFFTDHTIANFPLPDDLLLQLKNNILNEQEPVLSKVKQYIDNKLDPEKWNISNPLKDEFEGLPPIGNILKELGITEKEYYNALAISNESDFQIHIKHKLMHVLLTIILRKV